MKKNILLATIISLLSFSFIQNNSIVNAETFIEKESIQESISFEEDSIAPTSVTVSGIITYLTFLCVMHCDKIHVFVDNLDRTGGLGTIQMGRYLWNDFSNWMTTKYNRTPKSSNSSWNAPDGCVWSGPQIGGQWLCPYSV